MTTRRDLPSQCNSDMVQVEQKLGVATATKLMELGYTRERLRAEIASGDLSRIARGWYAARVHDKDAAYAASIGARLTCVSALFRYGVWMPIDDGALHIRLSHGARALDSNSAAERLALTANVVGDADLAIERDAVAVPALATHRIRGCRVSGSAIDDVETAFRCALKCLEPLDALTVADSLVNKELLSADRVRELAPDANRATRRALRYLDGRSQSGTESIVRYYIQRHRIRVRTQVKILGVGHVDLLVGDRLVIECDSKEHHSSWEARKTDLSRDLNAVAKGYVVVRLTYEQIYFEWDSTWAVIRRMLDLGAHRWTGASRRLNLSSLTGAASPESRH